ncbi:MAG: hypothetical protein COW59_05660 [Lysobacterales bacterium CG17_big_fil_post_rev_8_21_14_2_50_64_11]|nr:MAG: hypothetical protein COW59_05660 [Xanthomonadales bacterium CG17_big_fil_post_rev_8_21_14_2_50_64_11]PIX61375.1 MAG: hypothetical protein COZ47_02255 [Xanthomonadales bacterium CG_4_10_14_3_um_filter_64_11]
MRWQATTTTAALAVLLAGCAATDDPALAVKACANGVADKFTDKAFTLDHGALRSSVNVAENGLLLLSGPITINPGMTNEAKQTVQCKVRVADGKADLIALNFIW